MRKVALIAMAFGVIMLMAGPASATRSETLAYGSPAIGQGDLGSLCLSGDAPLNSCVTFAVVAGETSVHVSITDSSGLPTYGTVGQDYNDDGLTDASLNFCGSTTVPLALVPPSIGNYEIIVFPHAGPGLGNDAFAGTPEPCVGAGTSGTVTATFN
jgi:hypothetical protein